MEKQIIKSARCPECDNSQVFELPEKGKNLKVICHHCGACVVKIKNISDKKIEKDPKNTELTDL